MFIFFVFCFLNHILYHSGHFTMFVFVSVNNISQNGLLIFTYHYSIIYIPDGIFMPFLFILNRTYTVQEKF